MLEIDEHSHMDKRHPRPVSCELAKLDDTRYGVNGGGMGDEVLVPVVFVRFNPDACDRPAPSFSDRCVLVAERVNYYINCDIAELDALRVNVHYMFYHSRGQCHIDAAWAKVDNVNVLCVE